MPACDSHIKALLWLAYRLFQWIARTRKNSWEPCPWELFIRVRD